MADYFKKTITISFLDYLVSDTATRFTTHSKKVASIQELLPKSITPTSSFSKIEEAVAFYTDDLLNLTIVDEEFFCWKSKWLAVPKEDCPETTAESLKKCPQAALPSIFTLLQLFATLPLS